MLDFLKDYWELVLLVATWLFLGYLALRKRRDWSRKRFVQQVNFSLNYVEDGTLMLRTLLEASALDVWLNDYGVGLVKNAAAKTTVDQPFLRLSNRSDMAYVKRAVLNVLSERFSEVFIAKAVGRPVETAMFTYGLTWEVYGGIRTQKLRVIIMRTDDLNAMFEGSGGHDLKVVRESHRDRLTTLEIMYRLSKSKKQSRRAMIGQVELGIPVDRAGATLGEPWTAPPAEEAAVEETEVVGIPVSEPAPADAPQPPPLPVDREGS